jgi:RNA polymerase sigma-70 factor, ECF subfamily
MSSISFPDDSALVRALKVGHPGAPAALFDRHAAHVQRILLNVMGVDQELADLLHEVFARALAGVSKLKDHRRLGSWLTSIAINTARGCIRARTRRRWLRFWVREQQTRPAVEGVSPEVRQALRATYLVLERLPADLRIPFALRFVQGMELSDVAAACGVSLATIKRRLNRAEKRFIALARSQPALKSWIEGGRWRDR